jgi:hypothetical protein
MGTAEQNRAQRRQPQCDHAQSCKQTQNLESFSVATTSRSRSRNGSARTARLIPPSPTLRILHPLPLPKAPDSSNPSQPTKSVKNFFTTGCLKRITTLLEILRTERRTEGDDKLSVVDCVGIAGITCQRGIGQCSATSRDSEAQERGT